MDYEKLKSLDSLVKQNPENLHFAFSSKEELIRVPRRSTLKNPLSNGFRYYLIKKDSLIGKGCVSSVYKASKFIPSDSENPNPIAGKRKYVAKITKITDESLKGCEREDKIVSRLDYLHAKKAQYILDSSYLIMARLTPISYAPSEEGYNIAISYLNTILEHQKLGINNEDFKGIESVFTDGKRVCFIDYNIFANIPEDPSKMEGNACIQSFMRGWELFMYHKFPKLRENSQYLKLIKDVDFLKLKSSASREAERGNYLDFVWNATSKEVSEALKLFIDRFEKLVKELETR